MLVQVCVSVQVPLMQVCSTSTPEHCVVPLVQAPAHAPSAQFTGQTSFCTYLPSASHSMTFLSSQVLVPGSQMPVHDPSLHTKAQGAPGCHSPVCEQVSGTSPVVHCF